MRDGLSELNMMGVAVGWSSFLTGKRFVKLTFNGKSQVALRVKFTI